MSNTYYDSQLTAAEIEAALEAIDGVITPANNGKVLAIENGGIVAKDVSEYTDTAVLVSKSISANGNYDPASDNADGYSSVAVNVPNSYAAGDEGKVVSNGALVAQTSATKTQNGTYDTTLNNEIVVNVSGGGGTLITKTITQNGVYDATDDSADGYSEVTVNVSGGSSRLPDGYAELKYLITKKDATKSVTAIPVSVSVGDVFEFKYGKDTIPNDLFVPFGVLESSGTDFRFNVGMDNNQKRIFCGRGSICLDDDPTVTSDGSVTSYGNTVTSGDIVQKIKVLRIDTNNQKYLWYGSYVSTYDSYVLNGLKVYEVIAKRNNAVFFDCIPCLKNNNGSFQVGVYELISETFYTVPFDAGPFVGGNLKSKTITQNGTYDPADDNADGYSEVTVNVGDDWESLTDYIESSGTQWIDTGYTANDNTKVELVANVNTINAQYCALFGARNGDYEHATKEFLAYRDNNSTVFYVGSKPGKASFANSGYFGYKSKYTFSKTSICVQNADGYTCIGGGVNGGSVDNENSMYLLSFNQAGSDSGADAHCSAKLYRARIYESGTLVHEFVPWTDTNDVVCLKDTVTGNLKYNAGTGVFTRGTDS